MMKFLKGQSLFEVVGALAVVSILLIGLISVTTTSIKNTTSSKNNEIANGYAQGLTEWLRGQRDASWTDFKDNVATNGGVYCFNSPTLAWSNGGACQSNEFVTGTIFKRQVNFTCFQGTMSAACNLATVNLVQGSISITWADGTGNHTVNFVTELTNWRSN